MRTIKAFAIILFGSAVWALYVGNFVAVHGPVAARWGAMIGAFLYAAVLLLFVVIIWEFIRWVRDERSKAEERKLSGN